MTEHIEKFKNLEQEARFLKESPLTIRLVKVFCHDIKGTPQEKNEIDKIQKKHKNSFYQELMYILSHIMIDDNQHARQTYEKILHHKKDLSKNLHRNVGIEVACLDYLKNVESKYRQPEVIERKKLTQFIEKAIIDKTTGIYERDVLQTDLQSEFERAQRYNRTFTILFCDIDDFKKINDHYGHRKGDIVLRKVVRTMERELRTMDRLYRYGGEEFTIILPETRLKPAHILAERLCKNIAHLKITLNGDPLKVTISIGVVEFKKELYTNINQLLEKADAYMYKAKQQGKNRVCLYRPHAKHSAPPKPKTMRPSPSKPKRTVIKGLPLSQGQALGKAFIYKDILSRKIPFYDIEEKDISHELQRIKNAIQYVVKDLKRMEKAVEADMDKQHAAIFTSHREILKDQQLLDDIEFELRNELINAEHVIRNIFRKWARYFLSLPEKNQQSKSEDLDDLCRKIIRVLLGYEKNVLEKLPRQSVIVSHRLLPSDTVNIKIRHLKGIVVQEGSRHSHSAILAKTLGVPAFANLDKSIDLIHGKDEILLDTERKKIIVHPTAKDKNLFHREKGYNKKKRQRIIRSAQKPVSLNSGRQIRIYANVSSLQNTKDAFRNGADGIGLFRIEEIYLQSKTLPTEKYLMNKIHPILKQSKDTICTVRLLDIGGDKQLPYLDMEEEENPFLGLRGIRLLLKNEELLKTQIKALLRLAQEHSVRLLIPMVTLPEDIQRVRHVMHTCQKELDIESPMPLGAMVETPANLFTLQELIDNVDFINIGTNDLIQYVMAAGRENQQVLDYYKKGDRIITDIIRTIDDAAYKAGKECCLCGELASETSMIKPLLEAGLTAFSVSPHYIPEIKETIRHIGKIDH
jgi:phosphoenolpyruvate-protein phosphotransferase